MDKLQEVCFLAAVRPLAVSLGGEGVSIFARSFACGHRTSLDDNVGAQSSTVDTLWVGVRVAMDGRLQGDEVLLLWAYLLLGRFSETPGRGADHEDNVRPLVAR